MGFLARLLLLVALALAPAMAIQLQMVTSLRKARVAELHQEAQRMGDDAAGEIDRVVDGLRNLMIATSHIPAVRRFDSAECSAYIRDLQPMFPMLATLAAINADGRVMCHRDTLSDLSFADRDYFRDAMDRNDLAIGTFLVGRVNRTKVLPLAYPVRDDAGRPIGVIAIALDLGWLSQLLETRALPESGSVTIADRGGTVIARAPYADRFVGTVIPADYRHLVAAAEAGTIDLVSQDGTRRILGYKPVASGRAAGLYVSAGIAVGPAMAALDRATALGFAVIAAGVVLAVLAAVLGGQYFLRRPIRQLLVACQAWTAGDFAEARSPRGTPPELKRLGSVFNGLARLLGQRERERDAAATELRALNHRLEDQVAARTGELERLNRELTAANERLVAEMAEREQAEEALRQAQKIEAIGQLTGGVAHDFNNLLTAVLGNLELARRRIGDGEAGRQVGNAIQAAERGARLTAQLLAFARKQHLVLQAIDLNAVVRGMDDLLQRTIGATTRIEVQAGPDLWPATADQNQVELVILNLAINARDAMPAGGTVRIETRNLTVGAADPQRDVEPGDYVAVTLADTGTGMPPEVLAKAFEPFFTTKGPGKGSGLGLSQVWGVARQSGGTVRIISAPGRGTSVTVLLPRARQPAAAAAAAPVPAPLAGGGLRILLVDDDPGVRELVVNALEEMGHTVRAAAGGAEALQRLDAASPDDRPDLMLVDFAMPGMNGAEVATAALARRPGLPILFLTGYAEAGILDDWIPRAGVLRKPFRLEELAAAIEGALRGPSTGASVPQSAGDVPAA